MPFTPTHMAAVVPVFHAARGRLPLTALAIGSMVPDLPLFLPAALALGYESTHSISGIALMCLPLGFTAYLWFELFAKPALAELLPPSWLRRLHPHQSPGVEANWGFMLRVAIAIIIGASTHVFWDSFTHHGRWGYRQLPNMSQIVFQWGDYSLERYKALQHGSTILFAPLVALWAAWLLARRPANTDLRPLLQPTHRMLCIFGLFAIPIGTALLRCWLMRGQLVSVGHFARIAVTQCGFTFFVAVNVYALWVRQRAKRTEGA